MFIVKTSRKPISDPAGSFDFLDINHDAAFVNISTEGCDFNLEDIDSEELFAVGEDRKAAKTLKVEKYQVQVNIDQTLLAEN